MKVNEALLNDFYDGLDERSRAALDAATERVIEVKRRGGTVVVATGSGPNIHEGVTTLIAELMHKGIIDGVTTSSAVVGHEMAGALDLVKICKASELGFDERYIPRGGAFEFTQLDEAGLRRLRGEMVLDEELMARGERAEGRLVIKAAGNMAYPMGLRTENLGDEILVLARALGLPFETVAGWGADRRTMIGAGAELGLPVLVSIPQMVGSGHVGMAIGDSISIFERSARIAAMLASADVIIESAVALTQEIHDGPFECYTGHGIWSWWKGLPVFSLRGKTLVRIDLDENLRRARDLELESSLVQQAIDKGLPKTKLSKIPFRMEMSAFARLEDAIPVIGDIGQAWPVMAWRVAKALGRKLDFMSYAQQTPEGKAMRDWIVKEIEPLDRERMHARARAVRLSAAPAQEGEKA
ncbi:MAG: hypothetical protein GX181_03940 [Synergistaceae bacterium]|nr:hypothetical protein [Synergistota bacterium]NLM71099.1 hypothetical protein [Synergistaceae bacterium]